MDSSETQYLFKETRLNLEPPSSASVVTVRISDSNGRTKPKNANQSTVKDETTFRTKVLASASSIYHRKWHDSPRSFLWRVLENNTVLSIRSADICKKDKAADTPLVLDFHFGSAIQPNCIAFADSEVHDALCVFVLDQGYQLWTLTLRPDLFRKRSAVDAGLADLAKRHSPHGLSFKHPHRMVAISEDTVLVTVNDGGMIRFDRTREPNAMQAQWRETFFNVQGWAQNLRGLFPFQGKKTIRHGKINMEYSAATAVQVTSFGLEDTLFAVTICLDHQMRIWNLNDGQILHTSDILNIDRMTEDVGRWTIDPSQSNLIQMAGRKKGQRIFATFSPVGLGEFKFWRIIAKDSHTIIVEDLFSRTALVPVTPSSSDVWTLADFIFSSPEDGAFDLWTLWKNNMTYRVQRLGLDRDNIRKCWEENWEGVYYDTTVATAQTSGPSDPTDVTEKWLQTILQPGRFTKETLNTALSIYEQGLGVDKDSTKGCGLAESICSVLGSTAILERGTSGTMDFEQFRSSSEIQWRRFYRLLVQLDKQRGEAVGLSLDPDSGLTWVVCTDIVSAIHECNNLEKLCYNLASPEEDQVQESALINSALAFVDGFSDNFAQISTAALRQELFEESTKTDLERIQYFSDKSGFWRGITDDDCAQIVEALGDNFSVVTNQLYADFLGLIAAPAEAKRRDLRHPLSEFGQKLITKAVQENIDLQWKVCFSQLILLVHMEFEFDNEEDALHNRVHIGMVFRKLISALRRLELLKWLAKTEITTPLPWAEKNSSTASVKTSEDVQVVTALEANVGHLLGFATAKNEPLPVSITDLVSNLCAPDSDIEISPPLIQCSLVRQGRADLALDLSPFSEHDPFSVYVQGRILLALHDFTQAAIYFRKAAIGMSTENVKIDRHSSGLLDDTEWNLLNSGSAKYYSHIVALYERYRAYSYVVDFARLAIQFLDGKPENNLTKTDMLSRMFNAAVATSQFQLAHTSLLSFKDSALRHSSLRKLVEKMCETYHNTELVTLSFPGMQQEVDEILLQRSKASMDVLHGFPYHQVLYSWRIRHSNYRGAATVLLDRIHKLRIAGEGDKIAGDDILDTPVTKQYLLLINALSCVEAKQAWIYDEGVAGIETNGAPPPKRKVLSLADIRKQYQDELDRIAAIQNNQFGFEADDVMEIS